MNDLYTWIRPEIIAAYMLVLARMAGVFLVAPIFSNAAVSPRIRVALVIVSSLVLFPVVARTGVVCNFQSDLQLISMLIREVTIGLLIGYVAYLVFSAVQSTGEIMGMQLGLGIATIFDPANSGSASIITTLYVILGALIFLYLDGHHLILAGLIKSFAISPVSSPIRLEFSIGVASYMAKTFAIAIQMAIPLLVVTTVLNVIFGMITKLSPQLNIYFNVAFIITPILGIVVLMASLPLFRVLFTQLTESLEPEMIHLLKQMKGI